MNVEMLEEIRKLIVVSASAEKAWEVFVDRTTSWWPLASHSIGGDKATAALIEPDRVYERLADGTEHTWGRMVVWEPPHRLVFTWEVDPACQGEVEVRFTPQGDSTVVELEHRGWTRLSENERARYDAGWDFVLGRYETAV
jgi:uncharacterized protein YndB with AHSA1/START domain